MLVSKIKEIRNGRVITKDFKTKDRNLVDINQERRRLEDKYEQALRDGDKGLAKIYSNRLEELRKEAIEAENKRDEERKNFIQQLRILNVPVLVLVVTDSSKLVSDPGPMADKPQYFHQLEIGKIQEGLSKL